MNKILLNSIVGGTLFGMFTYFTQTYEEHPHYLKIGSFLWAAPLFYFFMVYITYSKSKEVMLAFTKHALMGTLLTICIFIFSIYFSHLPMMSVVLLNVVLLGFFVFMYFYNKVYINI